MVHLLLAFKLEAENHCGGKGKVGLARGGYWEGELEKKGREEEEEEQERGGRRWGRRKRASECGSVLCHLFLCTVHTQVYENFQDQGSGRAGWRR